MPDEKPQDAPDQGGNPSEFDEALDAASRLAAERRAAQAEAQEPRALPAWAKWALVAILVGQGVS